MSSWVVSRIGLFSPGGGGNASADVETWRIHASNGTVWDGLVAKSIAPAQAPNYAYRHRAGEGGGDMDDATTERAARAIYGLSPAHCSARVTIAGQAAVITGDIDWSDAPAWRRNRALLLARVALETAIVP